METEVVVALVGGGFGLAGTIAGTFLGAWVNRKGSLQAALQLAEVDQQKYARTRLWDARKDAYTAIIVEFNALSSLAARINDGFNDVDVNVEDYFYTAEFNRDNKEMWDRYRNLKVMIENQSLILSDRFIEQIGVWEADLFYYDEDDTPPIQANVHHSAMRMHTPLLVEIAKDEVTAKLSAGRR